VLACSIGLHWTFMQAVAWTGMVISYAQEAPLAEAVVKTFDGQHPCALCKQIAKGKRSEKKAEYKFELFKLKFPSAARAFIFDAPRLCWETTALNPAADSLTHAPPFPPPKGLFV
jgi:hypothetical protein